MVVSLCTRGTFGLWPMPESEGVGNVSVYLCLPPTAAPDASLPLKSDILGAISGIKAGGH